MSAKEVADSEKTSDAVVTHQERDALAFTWSGLHASLGYSSAGPRREVARPEEVEEDFQKLNNNVFPIF